MSYKNSESVIDILVYQDHCEETLEQSSATVSQQKCTELVSTVHSTIDEELKYSDTLSGTNGTVSNEEATYVLPWGVRKDRPSLSHTTDTKLRSGEFVMRTHFAEFVTQTEKKIETIIMEPLERLISKSLQRGEDVQFDQLLSTLGTVAEHCLPSLLQVLFAWHERQLCETPHSVPPDGSNDTSPRSSDSVLKSAKKNEPEVSGGSRLQERDYRKERRDLAIDFVFCLVLIETLRQLPLHPGHSDLVSYIENLAFKHFMYREGVTTSVNAGNTNVVADLYAEVIGVLAQSRFCSVKTRFLCELKELLQRELCHNASQSIIALLMGMKFIRVKMVPIEEFENSFLFLQDLARIFLEVKDRDVKHALAGLFVEILVPVAACVKNEVNVPCLKSFVDILYTHTLDMCAKGKHKLAIFPLLTCLLCVSHRQFFLANWHYFLAMCLSNLKNKDIKMSRVALESLYRLLWVYMIRIKCESNSATLSRLQSIVNSLFPKGSKNVVPRDTPLNIFVKIIQFIAQERLDFAMREIIFDLLSVGRSIKIVITPERMSVGLRAFLVIADSLEQKEGDPPMPRTLAVYPSGNTLRVKKTFLNSMLTDDTVHSIGISAYYPHVRKVFCDILRALDNQFGKTLLRNNTNKEIEFAITDERKPRMDLFRTCVAAIPRLIPDGLGKSELLEMLTRLTVHVDEELSVLSFQSLQNLVFYYPDWRSDVVHTLIWFVVKDIADTSPQLLDKELRMLYQLLSSWRSLLSSSSSTRSSTCHKQKQLQCDMPKCPDQLDYEYVLHETEALSLILLCHCRLSTRRLIVHILKEAKLLYSIIGCFHSDRFSPVIDIIDSVCSTVLERCLHILPASEKSAYYAAHKVDLQWISERSSSTWTSGMYDDGSHSNSVQCLLSDDAWSLCLSAFFELDQLASYCSVTLYHAWPIVYYRISNLYSTIDPTPVSDNRASLLRPNMATKKPSESSRSYLALWRNYIRFACHVVPPSISSLPSGSPSFSSTIKDRCISPEALICITPDLATVEIHGSALYKLIIPLIRCEISTELRDVAVDALGRINHLALKDLLSELGAYIREATDRKQENMRRRRRRDALRLQLINVFEKIADRGTFGVSNAFVDEDSHALYQPFLDYIDGTRLCFEMDILEKDTPIFYDMRLNFCLFIKKLIKCFSLESRTHLLPSQTRLNLFSLFTSWCNCAPPLVLTTPVSADSRAVSRAALCAAWHVVCCGPVFDSTLLREEGCVYQGMEQLFSYHCQDMRDLCLETLILLLEFNSDVSYLLDWIIDKCYTMNSCVTDICLEAIATVFSNREYPCDHYTAVITLALSCTACPRSDIQQMAVHLLQILDARFFARSLVSDETEDETREMATLDTCLSGYCCRSHVYLSKLLSQLHPHFTMSLFSEISHRLLTAILPMRQTLLQCLLPWLCNMELLDAVLQETNIQHQMTAQKPQSLVFDEELTQKSDNQRAWGSTEATEMVLNNLLYITAKIGDDHCPEIEKLWSTLCTCWPSNIHVVLRFLFIMCGIAPQELLPYGRRIIVYLARASPEQLMEHMISEMESVETLGYTVERTETPPFFRLISQKKISTHSVNETVITTMPNCLHEQKCIFTADNYDDMTNGDQIYQRQPHKFLRSLSFPESQNTSKTPTTNIESAERDMTTESVWQRETSTLGNPCTCAPDNVLTPQPRPLPMPEYGGYFAPLTEFLPDVSQSISNFYRCNLSLMLIQDVILDAPEVLISEWHVHVPLFLHVIFLGLDSIKPVVTENCKQLLLHLLIVVGCHGKHLDVARTLIRRKTERFDYEQLSRVVSSIVSCEENSNANFSPRTSWESDIIQANVSGSSISDSADDTVTMTTVVNATSHSAFNINTSLRNLTQCNMSAMCLFLINYLSSKRCKQLWKNEDATPKIWQLESSERMRQLFEPTLHVFALSLPQMYIQSNWSSIALHVALSCSSRHLACRSLQLFRLLRPCLTSTMLSDILSRLIETVSEPAEDIQGYVVELILSLCEAVEFVVDMRPIDFARDLFKSTPNLLECDLPKPPAFGSVGPLHGSHLVNRLRRAPKYSDSAVACLRTELAADSSVTGQHHTVDSDTLGYMDEDVVTTQNSITLLVQLFWISVSLLESDYEHEFLLAIRLLSKVLQKLSFDRPDCRDRIEKMFARLRWSNYPGVHALLLKGCTNSLTYEPTLELLSYLTARLETSAVVGDSHNVDFLMNVLALMPYLIYKYENPDELCLKSAERIAQVCMDKNKQLDNLATVMTLYSRRTFNKESLQWTKCVIKYLTDTFGCLSCSSMMFLVEMLEKGPSYIQQPILSIFHCLMHYAETSVFHSCTISSHVLRSIIRYSQIHPGCWKDTLRILKLTVSQCSSLDSESSPASESARINECLLKSPNLFKKELPGRTMSFTYDIDNIPIIGGEHLRSVVSTADPEGGAPLSGTEENSPKRTVTALSSDVSTASSWKRPWVSQIRTRERLTNVLLCFGNRIGLPKSPSVIFSQNSDALDQQSSVTSSTEEVSANGHHTVVSAESLDDHTEIQRQQFGVIREFDFLEYELESQEGESLDNFNWGVRRKSPGEMDNSDVGFPLSSMSTFVSSNNYSLSTQPSTREDYSDEDEDGVTGFDPGVDTDVMTMAHSVTLEESHHALDSFAERLDNKDADFDTEDEFVDGDNISETTPRNCSINTSVTLQRWNSVACNWLSRVSLITLSDTSDSSESTNTADCALTASVTVDFCRLLHVMFDNLRHSIELSLTHLQGSSPEISSNLQKCRDSLVSICLPYFYTNGCTLATMGLRPKLNFILLELHNHIEIYRELHEHFLHSLETLQSHRARDMTSCHSSSQQSTHCVEQLCRSLYKLIFQFISLLETFLKACLLFVAMNEQVVDMTGQVCAMYENLMQQQQSNAAFIEASSDESSSLSVEEITNKCVSLFTEKQYHEAVIYFNTNRHLLCSETQLTDEHSSFICLLDIFFHSLSLSTNPIFCCHSLSHSMSFSFADLQQSTMGLFCSIRSYVSDHVSRCDI